MANEQVKSSKKITIGFILGWIFGIIFAFLGTVAVFSEPIPGIVFLIMAAVTLPPINKLVNKKWNFHLSGGMKLLIIIIGFAIFGSTINTSKKQNEQLPVQQEESVASTGQNEDEINSSEEESKTIDNESIVETERVEPNSAVSEIEQNEDEIEFLEGEPSAVNNENVAEIERKEEVPTSNVESDVVKKTTIPAEYKSALNKAMIYARTMHMSKQGIYDQLVSEYGEKFSTDAAQYAIDNMTTDWNENALAKARIYQDTMSMSPSAIHDQLTSAYGEKFTKSEADYAIQYLND